jgi:hypothetical protein
MKALIDGDLLVYAIGYIKGEDGNERPWPLVASNLNQSIRNIVDDCGADSYRLYLTSDDRSNFRIQTATIKEYKGNRKTEKPFWYQTIRNYLILERDAEIVRFMEADDALGVAQCESLHHQAQGLEDPRYPKVPDWDTTIICSLDKDLDTIPGWHYNWHKKEKYYVDDIQALRNFYCQLLVGDTADNIHGLSGVGPRSKYLDNIQNCDTEVEMFKIARTMYEKYYGNYWADFLEENFKLLWIKRTMEGSCPEEEATRRLANMMIESIAQD